MNEPALMAVVKAVSAGQAPPEELVEALEITRRELEIQRDGFEGALAREASPVQRAVTPEVNAVNQSLEDYLLVLDSCGAYLQGFDAAFLESALENLPRAATRLDLDFLRFREAVMAQRGPTAHAGLNQLLADPGEGLDLLLELEMARVQSALGHLATSERHALSPLWHQWHQDYARVLTAPVDEQWFSGLEELGERWARINTDAVTRHYATHPTALVTLNLTVNSAWLVSQERVEPELCFYFLDLLQRELAAQDFSAVRVLLDWCERMGAWLEQPSEEGLQPLIQGAIAGGELYRSATTAEPGN